jgi:hypothetical protein
VTILLFIVFLQPKKQVLRMKKVFLISLAMAAAFSTKAADYTYLTLVEQDGTKTSLTAVGLTITFSNGNLVATNADTSETKTIALSDLVSMNFSNSNETTGINSIEAEDFSLNEADAVYDLTGRRIPSNTSLSKGIYIIKKGSITRKIQVR